MVLGAIFSKFDGSSGVCVKDNFDMNVWVVAVSLASKALYHVVITL